LLLVLLLLLLLLLLQVAVKCVTVRSEAELLNFLREVECLAALRHPNVVPFLGAVLQVRRRPLCFE
jgi:serine/threonine protein kinase